MLALGVSHIVAAGVLAGGAWFHRQRLPASLAAAQGNASAFHFEWGDAKKLGFILGHHLIVLGLGALLLVLKATRFGGLYDAALGEVRLVTDPTLGWDTLWSYRTHLFDVNNLEDLVGGHVYVAVLLIAGGAWHILVPPFNWVRQRFLFSGDGILAYSLFGIALAGFAASYYCGFNTLAYPTEFYGPALQLKSAFLPSYFDPNRLPGAGYSSRTWLANAHFYLAFFFLQGGLWHYQRAMGFDLAGLFATWRQAKLEASENPTLAYQKPMQNAPSPQRQVQYGAPDLEPQPLLAIEQSFGEFLYRPSQGIATPDLTQVNGVRTTLYQTAFRSRHYRFYQRATQTAKAEFGYGGGRSAGCLYEPAKAPASPGAYPTPLPSVMYEPSHSPDQTATVALEVIAPAP